MEDLKIKRHRNEIKTKLQKEYPALTDNDLTFTHEKENEWVGRIERRLGNDKRERIVNRIKTPGRF